MDEQNRKREQIPVEQVNEEEQFDETDEVLDIEGAEDSITDMEAREQRRDSTYRTGGDNHSPGVDVDLDSNAPKKQEMPRKKSEGSRGKSDWC